MTMAAAVAQNQARRCWAFIVMDWVHNLTCVYELKHWRELGRVWRQHSVLWRWSCWAVSGGFPLGGSGIEDIDVRDSRSSAGEAKLVLRLVAIIGP